MKIGNKLKAFRTSKGYTPDFVSEKLGISKTTYGRYERNESVPDLNTLESISELYDVTLAELLNETNSVTQCNK